MNKLRTARHDFREIFAIRRKKKENTNHGVYLEMFKNRFLPKWLNDS